MTQDWEKCLWDELDLLPDNEKFIRYSEVITHITRELLPRLGDLRRDLVLKLVEVEGADATSVAESVGSRRTAIQRLAQEARARRREQAAQAP